jgi:RNA polymerase sigma factor (sigma-70 family)
MRLEGAFEAVLSAAQANAGWAFRRLYESLASAVTGYARAQGVRDADDVVNEVFLAAFTKIATFVGNEAQFRSWVFTIAHHKVVDQRRAAARRPQVDPLDAMGDRGTPGGHTRSAEEEALAGAGLGQLRSLLDRLSPEQRDVVVLRVVADLSVEEVAELLGKQPGAVRALQFRALNALRRALAGEAVTR